jgi:hypothetical protein
LALELDSINPFLEFEIIQVHTEGELAGMTTYRLYLYTAHDDDFLVSCSGDDENPLYLTSTTEPAWFQHEFATTAFATDINPVFFSTFPEFAYDSWLTIGAEDNTAAADIISLADPNYDAFAAFEAGENVAVTTTVGNAWFVLPIASNVEAISGDDYRVLVAQFTTAGEISGQIQCQVLLNGDNQNEFRDVLAFSTTSSTTNVYGCTDESAANFCPSVEFDDGSCFYEYFGCLDEQACNYSATATIGDEALCVYIQPGACDCDGNVLDGCGVCGGDGIPEGQCDCEGNVLDAVGVCGGDCESDANGNGICDVDEVGGPEACGWGTVWNADSAACVLAVPPFLGEFGDYNTLNPCYYDLDLSGSVGAGDLINFLSTYNLVTGCSWTDE